MGLGKIITYRKLGQSFFGAIYVSGSLETGSVWQDDKQFNPSGLCLAGSLFLGYDTVIAPLMDVLTRDMARALCTSAEHLVNAVRS